jgi:hypothetical protein
LYRGRIQPQRAQGLSPLQTIDEKPWSPEKAAESHTTTRSLPENMADGHSQLL